MIIICVDGLPYDLFNQENMPFLYNYAQQNHYGKLKTLFAFTGLEFAFFTGKTPDQTNIWLEFVKKDSIFKSKLIKLFSFNKKLRNYSAVLVQLMKKRNWLSILHNIPQEKVKYFDTSTEKNLWDLDFFFGRTFALYKYPFFVTEKSKKIIFRYESDEKRLSRLLKQKNKNIYYTQLMSIDKTIHRFGKNSPETKKALQKLDKILEKFINKTNEDILIWSDHGFSDIQQNIDLQSLLPKSDYLAFFAGTTAHFWFNDDQTKRFIENILSKQNFGFILTDDLKKKYKIPSSPLHGDLIFAMKPGYYLFPNYYQKKPFKAMHGYPGDLDGVFITNKPLNKQEIPIQEVLKWMN